MIRRDMPTIVAIALVMSVAAAQAADFSGKWVFNSTKSQNVGMMAQAVVVSTIVQTSGQLRVDSHSSFGGESLDDHTIYDLSGKPIQNTSRMAGIGTSVSSWRGDRLVSEWQNNGTLPGSVTTRIETRYLSSDQKTMTVESSRSGKPIIVMVFDRQS